VEAKAYARQSTSTQAVAMASRTRRSSYSMVMRNKPFEALAHDSTATIGFWKPPMHETLDAKPRWNDGIAPNTKNWQGKGHSRLERGTVGLFDAPGTLVRRPTDDWLDQASVDDETFPISAASVSKAEGRTAVYNETMAPVTSVIEKVEEPLSKEELTATRGQQKSSVKGQHARRREVAKPPISQAEIDFANSVVKHVTAFDDTKLKKMEAEMYRKFNEKVAGPTANLRVSREVEQRSAHVTELCRGNELFDKADYLAALAEYEIAADKPQLAMLAPFAHLNRGNCYKALSFRPQASAAYRQVIDATSALRSPAEKLLHACALNNLGAVCKDGGRLEQALQHLSAALALFPRSHLALKNLAEVHMVYARQLGAADLAALVPPQHEMANNAYGRTLECDWHLPLVFCVGKRPDEVPLRIDTRITSEREEGAPEHNPNEVYHVSLNLTHVHRVN